jgi:hypothetical protein
MLEMMSRLLGWCSFGLRISFLCMPYGFIVILHSQFYTDNQFGVFFLFYYSHS